MPWTVARTECNRERRAALNVERHGFGSYLPRYRNPHGDIRLLFPRYLFVCWNEAWQRLLRIDGLVRLLLSGDHPGNVHENFIQNLKSMQGRDGIIKLAPEPERFKPHQKLQVVRGQFKNLIASYEGISARNRELAYVDFLGRKVKVEFEDGHLAAWPA